MNNWNLAAILDRLDAIILGAIKTVHNAMVTENTDLFWAAAAIAFGILAFQTFTPGGSYNMRDFLIRVGAGVVVYTMLMTWDYYGGYIVPLFYDWPIALSGSVISLITGTAMSGPNEAFERLAEAAIRAGFVISEHGKSVLEMAISAVYAIIFTLVFGRLIVSGLRPLLVAKLSLMVMAAISPLMVVAFLFNRTRAMVTAWMQVLISNSLVIFITYIVIALFTVIAHGFLAYFAGIDSLLELMEIAFAFGLVLVAIQGQVEEVTTHARNIGGAFGLSNPVTGGKAAWGKFIARARSAMTPNRGGAVKPT